MSEKSSSTELAPILRSMASIISWSRLGKSGWESVNGSFFILLRARCKTIKIRIPAALVHSLEASFFAGGVLDTSACRASVRGWRPVPGRTCRHRDEPVHSEQVRLCRDERDGQVQQQRVIPSPDTDAANGSPTEHFFTVRWELLARRRGVQPYRLAELHGASLQHQLSEYPSTERREHLLT